MPISEHDMIMKHRKNRIDGLANLFAVFLCGLRVIVLGLEVLSDCLIWVRVRKVAFFTSFSLLGKKMDRLVVEGGFSSVWQNLGYY